MGKRHRRGSDAKLLRLEGKFNVASDRWNEASARTAEIEEEFDRLQARLREAEEEEERRAAVFTRLFEKVMRTRARTLSGLLVKVRVRERDYTDAEDAEITVLKSLVTDIKRMGRRRKGDR